MIIFINLKWEKIVLKKWWYNSNKNKTRKKRKKQRYKTSYKF